MWECPSGGRALRLAVCHTLHSNGLSGKRSQLPLEDIDLVTQPGRLLVSSLGAIKNENSDRTHGEISRSDFVSLIQ